MRWPTVMVMSALIASSTALATTYVLHPDGSGDFPTIQVAIDACGDGDVIELTDGTFAGDGNRDMDYLGKAITVRSQSGIADACLIDCDGTAAEPHRAFNFRTGEGPEAVLEEIGIVDGWGHLNPREFHEAGAILCEDASPTITGCFFSGNRADFGAVILLRGASVSTPTLTHCTFTENQAGFDAGAVSCCEMSAPIVTDCLFADNMSAYRAGVLMVDDHSTPLISRCTFIRNSSNLGGAVFCCGESFGYLFQCTFHENASAVGGAGIASSCDALVRLECGIIAFSTEGTPVDCGGSSSAQLVCCDVYGNAGGDWVGPIEDQFGIDGNFAEDPIFCDPGSDDLVLHRDSPCLPGRHPTGDPCGLIGAWPIGCPAGGVEDGGSVPTRALLCAAAPNPFAERVTITYLVPRDGSADPAGGARSDAGEVAPAVRVDILDPGGRLQRTLVAESQLPGVRSIVWNGRDQAGQRVGNGTYFVRLIVGDLESARCLTVLR